MPFASAPPIVLADVIVASTQTLLTLLRRHVGSQALEADGLGECEGAGHTGEVGENELACCDVSPGN